MTIAQFKSYYVVWKLSETPSKLTAKEKFKSYYVVWKRRSGSIIHPPVELFKSYYVVWKPENENNIGRSIEGLNRSM